MPGIFSKANRPKRPGAYFNFISAPVQVLPPSPGSIVCVVATHDWGPLEQSVLVSSFGEFQAIFGSADDTPLYRAVRQAFTGEGLPGRLGAGGVLVYRIGGTSAAKATKVLQNTTPVNAITLTAKYEGSRANDLRVTTQDNALNSANAELVILDGTTVLETWVYPDTDIANLVAQINNPVTGSDWVTAAQNATGVALGNVSAQAFTAGDDGSTLVSGDWTSALTALGSKQFAVFAPYNLTDSGIVASVKAWAQNLNAKGRRFFTILGGAAGESVSTANTRSASLADPNIINLGAATLTDEDLGTGGTPLDIGTAELVPRIAGILASRGEYGSLTGARLAGTTLKVGPDDAAVESAFDGGTIVFAVDTDAVAPVHVSKGMSTWTNANAIADPTKPYLIYRQPKYVRTMHGIETDLTAFAQREIIGRVSITSGTRDAVIAEAKRVLRERESSGVIQPGWTVGIDQDPPPTDEDEFVALAMSIKFGRALEQLYFTVTVA